MFFFPGIYEKVEGGGGGFRGTLGFSRNVFFIVERVGRGSPGVIFFTNSLWDGGEGAPWERVHLDFFSSFFLLWRGRGVEGNVFFWAFI